MAAATKLSFTAAAALRRGVVFIALNDGPADKGALDKKVVARYMSTVCLSETFDVPAGQIAQMVIDERRRSVR